MHIMAYDGLGPLAVEVPFYFGDIAAGLPIVSRSDTAEKITGGLSITTKMP